MNKNLHPIAVALIFVGLTVALGFVFQSMLGATVCMAMILVIVGIINGLRRLDAWDAKRRGRSINLSNRTIAAVFGAVILVMMVIFGTVCGWPMALAVPCGAVLAVLIMFLYDMLWQCLVFAVAIPIIGCVRLVRIIWRPMQRKEIGGQPPTLPYPENRGGPPQG